MKTKISLLITLMVVLTGGILLNPEHPTVKAQETAAAPMPAPAAVIDQIMGLIGHGRIDEGVAMMEGLKNQPDVREEARGRLARLATDEGTYRGYDVAAIQRFTAQLQTMDVLAYYDEQPVLFRFHFYRPHIADNVKWIVLGFQVTTAMQEINDVLKDTPVDYVGRQAGK